jgi:hypothetical protein
MMFRSISTVLPALLLAATGAFAAEPPAQQSPPAAPASKPSTDASPAVDTSAPQPAQDAPPAQNAASPQAAQSDSKPAAPGRRVQADRLDLDTTIVTGNRELPKVLYIVPWKKADLGDLPAQPFNTLLDEVLTPVDRDVFRREVTYYGVVSAGGNASPAAPAQPTSAAGAPARGDEK